jgi:hypothetical protein
MHFREQNLPAFVLRSWKTNSERQTSQDRRSIALRFPLMTIISALLGRPADTRIDAALH